MLLKTSIKPRRDGVVKVLGMDGATYVFKDDGSGELVADVPHSPTLEALAGSGNFFAVEQDDELELMRLSGPGAVLALDEDEAVNLDALPVEGVGANPQAASAVKPMGKRIGKHRA